MATPATETSQQRNEAKKNFYVVTCSGRNRRKISLKPWPFNKEDNSIKNTQDDIFDILRNQKVELEKIGLDPIKDPFNKYQYDPVCLSSFSI